MIFRYIFAIMIFVLLSNTAKSQSTYSTVYKASDRNKAINEIIDNTTSIYTKKEVTEYDIIYSGIFSWGNNSEKEIHFSIKLNLLGESYLKYADGNKYLLLSIKEYKNFDLFIFEGYNVFKIDK